MSILVQESGLSSEIVALTEGGYIDGEWRILNKNINVLKALMPCTVKILYSRKYDIVF